MCFEPDCAFKDYLICFICNAVFMYAFKTFKLIFCLKLVTGEKQCRKPLYGSVAALWLTCALDDDENGILRIESMSSL